MDWLYLGVGIFTNSLQSAFKKVLNKRASHSEFTFSAMITTAALLFFVIFSGNISYSWSFVPYSAVYSICYATAAVTCVLALSCGSLALTNLALVYSGVIPLLYSLLFCGEQMNGFQIGGLICLWSSFVLTYYRREKTRQPFSIKWMVYVGLLFLSNGMCGVLSRMQQRIFGGVYDRSFMIVSMTMAGILLWIAAIVRERHEMKTAVRCGWWLSATCGTFNGVTNFLGLMCLLVIPGVIYYPVSSAGSLVVTCLLSMVVFKERFTRAQLVGFVLGVVAVVLLNLTV